MQEKLLYLQVKSESKAAKSEKERTWRERRELRREQNPFSHLLFRHSQNTIGENFYTFLLLLTKKRKEV